MKNKFLWLLLMLLTFVLAGCTMGLADQVSMEGITFSDLDNVSDNEYFPSINCDFSFEEEEDNLYVGGYHQFKIISHGYPNQYIYYVVDRMYESYDDILKTYDDLKEETIELHFYMNEKDFMRLSRIPSIEAFTQKNTVNFKMTTDQVDFYKEYMFKQVYINSLHELEHVFQIWYLGDAFNNFEQIWLLDALASYKSYAAYDIGEGVNLTVNDTFYITDFYSMMGRVWCYEYGFYLIDYFIDDLGINYVDILDQPDVETLTGMTKSEIFEDWKVFMEEKYNLVYKSEGNE